MKFRKFINIITESRSDGTSSYFPSGKYYHLSLKKITGVLRPRIPDNFLVKSGYEDSTTKRVSASTSIDGCLRAMSMDLEGKTLYVYELSTKGRVKKPSVEEVPDSKLTDEIWILDEAETKLVGSIFVIKAKSKPLPYLYGDGLKAELYDWVWEIV